MSKTLGRVCIGCWILTVVGIQELPAQEKGAQILGQVVGREVILDDILVPSGTTLFSQTELQTGSHPASIRFSSGQVLTVNRHSRAFFEKTPTHLTRVLVRSGTLAFHRGSKTAVLSSNDELLLTPDASQDSILSDPVGVVAVLRQPAEKGTQELRVNDAGSIQADQHLLIRSRQGGGQESVAVASVKERVVTLREPLTLNYTAEDPLILEPGVASHRVQATLVEAVADGDRTLRAKGSENVNLLERLTVLSLRKPLQETVVVRSMEPDLESPGIFILRLDSGIQHPFEKESQILQGGGESSPQLLRLKAPAKAGQKRLVIGNPGELSLLEKVVLQSLDGKKTESHCIDYIESQTVVLRDDLTYDYDPGAQLSQSSDGVGSPRETERGSETNNCRSVAAAAQNNLQGGFPWWLVAGSGGGATTAIVTTQGTGEDPNETPPSPTTPVP